MKIETYLHDAPLDKLQTLARLAEEVGVDGIAQPEVRRDPFLALGQMAPATRRARLATSVAIAFPRSPMVVAYLARDLQDLSAGRFALGLGTQVKGHIVRRFSTTWDSPGPRLREYVQALRAIWACWQDGTPLRFDGQFYRFTLMTPEFSPGPSRHGPIPVQVAAVNSYNLQLAGELCDGLRIHPFSTAEYIREVIWPNLERGAARAGRAPDTVELIGGGFLATGVDEAAVQAAREDVRKRVAFYASTPAYRAILEHHGWQDLGGALRRLIAQGRWDDLASLVGDDVLDRFCIVGTYETIAARARERYAGLVDWLGVTFPDDAAANRDRLAQALAELRAIPGRRERPEAGGGEP